MGKKTMDPAHLRRGKTSVTISFDVDPALALAVEAMDGPEGTTARAKLERLCLVAVERRLAEKREEGEKLLAMAKAQKRQAQAMAMAQKQQAQARKHLDALAKLGVNVGSIAGPNIPGAGQEEVPPAVLPPEDAFDARGLYAGLKRADDGAVRQEPQMAPPQTIPPTGMIEPVPPGLKRYRGFNPDEYEEGLGDLPDEEPDPHDEAGVG